MTRQKQVFPRNTVAHLWAHKAQDSARDPSGNFYFSRRTIYSYGSHFAIAHILSDECGPEFAGRVLWNDATYSNTTSKMQRIARQALTRQQRETMLHMPGSIGMGRNIDPHRIERDLIAKRLPDVSALLVARVIECVAGLTGKRYESGPWSQLMSEAYKAQALALMFYAKAKRKYPLALLDSRPVSSDKKEWAAWIKSMASGKIKADYAAAVKAANDYARQAREQAASCGNGFPYFDHKPGCEWEARSIVGGTHDVAQRAIQQIGKARGHYATLNGVDKKPLALLKLEKEMRAITDVFKTRVDEFTRKETQNRVIYDIREAARHARNRKANKTYIPPRYFADMESLFTRATECGLTDEMYIGLASRLSRIGAAMSARSALKGAREALDSAGSFMPKFPADAMRHAGNAILKIEFIGRLDIAIGLRAHMHADISETMNSARALRESAYASIQAANADRLRAWLACESNVRPAFEAGTFARINGNVVETTRGASVPVEHACRLSRMYAIAVRKGGAEWADGAGPMVGHYRVNKIGADGSLIIGCHEFTADEAKRLHAILESCEACATVAA